MRVSHARDFATSRRDDTTITKPLITKKISTPAEPLVYAAPGEAMKLGVGAARAAGVSRGAAATAGKVGFTRVTPSL